MQQRYLLRGVDQREMLLIAALLALNQCYDAVDSIMLLEECEVNSTIEEWNDIFLGDILLRINSNHKQQTVFLSSSN